ncbi:hypothetical protein GGR54DRAFT_640023 [Hypoxylon sp. NC1633]|nr:hypothetical protein GGR54DRAFT_640023 [Hypoxylon sp. NC1633]
MASPGRDHGTTLPPKVSPKASRGCDSRDSNRIIVQPTDEYQKVYNEIRQTYERQHLQTHIASQKSLLPPSAAPSVSTVHSPVDDLGTPFSHDTTAQDPDQQKRPRGRRKGPLEAQTRLNTAVKRKLKLTCQPHRAKKITCDCHDFSKLEENYLKSQRSPSSSGRRSHDGSDTPPLTSVERTLNRETFGAGGGALESLDQDATPNDLADILEPSSTSYGGVVRLNVQRIVNEFDTDSVHLEETMLQATGQPYHPGSNDIGQPSGGDVQDDLLEIGSQNRDYPIRWHCEYKGTGDVMSETSSETCSWTGPIAQLRCHFRTTHHPFQDASPRFRLLCTICGAKALAQDDGELPLSPFHCTRESCSGSSCQRWYYGSTREVSRPESVAALTQSSESEAGFSWNLQADGNQSWQGGRGPNEGFNLYYGSGSSREQSEFHNSRWDTWSSSSSRSSISDYSLQDCFPARKETSGWRPSADPGTSTPHNTTRSGHSSHRCPVRLASCFKLPKGQLLCIMIPLLATIVRESGYIIESSPLSCYETNGNAIGWCSLGLLLLGFVATWTFKDRARSWTDEVSFEGAPKSSRPPASWERIEV